MSLSKVIEIARNELGVTEDPAGSNIQKYGAAYELNAAPWCVIFLWWCFCQAGERMAFFGGGQTASCGTLLRWYKAQGLTVPVDRVQAGDIVILDFSGAGDTEHCGLVVETWHRKTGELTFVDTIEGNTSPSDGSQSNGGMVCLKSRYPSQIVGVCRPQYQPESPAPVDDITGRWSEEDIRWCLEHGLLKGYPDGSFKPQQAVTREELAAVIRRLVEM